MLYENFIKNASLYMDVKEIPNHVKLAAYSLYKSLPIKSAHTIIESYEVSKVASEKIALEMVGASIIAEATNKRASLLSALPTVGKALMHPVTHAGLQMAGVAGTAITKDRSGLGTKPPEGAGLPHVG